MASRGRSQIDMRRMLKGPSWFLVLAAKREVLIHYADISLGIPMSFVMFEWRVSGD
jgi:hypothetical protein